MATQTVRALEIAFQPQYANESFEAASQTFKKGALLVYDSNGFLAEASADPTIVAGIALEAGHNYASATVSRKCQFMPLLPGTLVEGNWVPGATGNHTLFGTAINVRCGVIKRTTESDTPWAFDASETGTPALFRVVGFKDASADVNARVFAVIMATRSAWSGY